MRQTDEEFRQSARNAVAFFTAMDAGDAEFTATVAAMIIDSPDPGVRLHQAIRLLGGTSVVARWLIEELVGRTDRTKDEVLADLNAYIDRITAN